MPRREKLTKRVIDAADPRPTRYTLWDTQLPGFGCIVAPNGRKTFVVRYRPRGKARPAPKRFISIGRFGLITADEARNRAAQILAAASRGQDPALESRQAASALTVSECAAEFLKKHVEPKRRPSTSSSYRYVLEKHVLPRLGTRLITSLTRNDLAALHHSLRRSPAAANRTLAIVSSMFRWAERQGHVPDGMNPASRIDHFRTVARERYLSPDEMVRLGLALKEAETVGIPFVVDESQPNAKHAPKPENRRTRLDMHVTSSIRLLLLTGCRLREILNLQWDHVDLAHGVLSIPITKTGRKTVLLGAAAVAIFAALPKMGPWVFPGLDGERPRTGLTRPWQLVRMRAGLGDVRLHDLRHSFASVCADAELSLVMIGKLLGHSQPATTARYAHLSDDLFVRPLIASLLKSPRQ